MTMAKLVLTINHTRTTANVGTTAARARLLMLEMTVSRVILTGAINMPITMQKSVPTHARPEPHPTMLMIVELVRVPLHMLNTRLTRASRLAHRVRPRMMITTARLVRGTCRTLITTRTSVSVRVQRGRHLMTTRTVPFARETHDTLIMKQRPVSRSVLLDQLALRTATVSSVQRLIQL